MKKLIFASVLVVIMGCKKDESREKPSSEKAQKSKSGITKLYYPNGKLKAEVPVVNGKKNGLAKDYYQSGKPHLEIEYVNNVKHGFTKMYYESGILFEESHYMNGKQDGIHRKYRQDGKISSEATFKRGEPCVGLKEYLLDGTLKKNYPKIVVKEVDKILLEDQFILRLSMSDKSKNVVFYQGKLEGDCITDKLERIYETPEKGVSELSFYLPRGAFMMEEINIVAKVKTAQGNVYLTQHKYNLAIENR